MNSGNSRAFAIAAAVSLGMAFGATSAWGSGLSSGFTIHATPIAGLVRPISSEASVSRNRTPSRLFGAGGYQLGDTPSGGSPPVLYGGGAVMHAVTTHVIAWAPSGFSFPSGYVSGYARYLSDLSHDLGFISNASSVLAQYVDASGSPLTSLTNAAPISDTDPYPASGCQVSGAGVCLTEPQVLTEAADQIASYGLSSDLNQSYIVLLPPGVDSCYDAGGTECEGKAFCAYHASFPLGINTITYTTLTLVPYTGSSYNNTGGHCELPTGPGPAAFSPDLIALESIGTHELFESATDPMIGSGYIDSTGYEIADECEFAYGPESPATPSGFYNQLLNGNQYLIQEIWSDQDNGCARGEAAAATASITAPSTVRTGSAVRLSATLADAGLASASTYKWSYRDPLGENKLNIASGPNPQITLPIVGTYTVWVTITDTAGGTVTGVRNVAAGDSRRPAAWFTWSPAHPTAGTSVRFFPRGVGSTTSITRYSWRFGGRSTSRWAIPAHAYGTVGHHTVTLTVTRDGLTGRVHRSIAVAARPPRAKR